MAYTSPFKTAWGRQRTTPRYTSPFPTAWGRQQTETPGYTPPKPAATSGASAAGTGATNLPVDPILANQISGLAKRRDQTAAGLGGQRATGLLDFGYTEDPTGALAVDASNPYSRAALLKQQYDRAATGAQTSMAARGQLFSGAYENAKANVAGQRGQADDALLKALTRFLAGNTQGVQQATTDFEVGAGTAEANAAARIPTNPAYEPGSVAPAPPPAPKPVKPPKSRRPRKR